MFSLSLHKGMNYTAFCLKYKLKKAEIPNIYHYCAIIIHTFLPLRKKDRASWHSFALPAVQANQKDYLHLTLRSEKTFEFQRVPVLYV